MTPLVGQADWGGPELELLTPLERWSGPRTERCEGKRCHSRDGTGRVVDDFGGLDKAKLAGRASRSVAIVPAKIFARASRQRVEGAKWKSSRTRKVSRLAFVGTSYGVKRRVGAKSPTRLCIDERRFSNPNVRDAEGRAPRNRFSKPGFEKMRQRGRLLRVLARRCTRSGGCLETARCGRNRQSPLASLRGRSRSASQFSWCLVLYCSHSRPSAPSLCIDAAWRTSGPRLAAFRMRRNGIGTTRGRRRGGGGG